MEREEEGRVFRWVEAVTEARSSVDVSEEAASRWEGRTEGRCAPVGTEEQSRRPLWGCVRGGLPLLMLTVLSRARCQGPRVLVELGRKSEK